MHNKRHILVLIMFPFNSRVLGSFYNVCSVGRYIMIVKKDKDTSSFISWTSFPIFPSSIPAQVSPHALLTVLMSDGDNLIFAYFQADFLGKTAYDSSMHFVKEDMTKLSQKANLWWVTYWSYCTCILDGGCRCEQNIFYQWSDCE